MRHETGQAAKSGGRGFWARFWANLRGSFGGVCF
jgi:hypothetical protein